MFKVGDRVEYCDGGLFWMYEDSNNYRLHDFGEVTKVDSTGVFCKWDGSNSEMFVQFGYIRKAPLKAPTRKNLKLELRVKGLELTIKVLEQDDEDICKDRKTGFVFESSDGFAIHSAGVVGICDVDKVFIKGPEGWDKYIYEFDSNLTLNNYISHLKQAVKEFNAAGGFAKKIEETVEIVE